MIRNIEGGKEHKLNQQDPLGKFGLASFLWSGQAHLFLLDADASTYLILPCINTLTGHSIILGERKSRGGKVIIWPN